MVSSAQLQSKPKLYSISDIVASLLKGRKKLGRPPAVRVRKTGVVVFKITVVGKAYSVEPGRNRGKSHICHAEKGILGIAAMHMLIPEYQVCTFFLRLKRPVTAEPAEYRVSKAYMNLMPVSTGK
jgi:hypothetical protein